MAIRKEALKDQLYALIDCVEQYGSALIEGTEDNPLILSRAITIHRHYIGLKREAAEESFQLLDPNDPYYGWGLLVHHDPVLIPDKPLEPVPEHLLDYPDARKAWEGEQLKTTTARIEVYKREELVPTIPIAFIRATVAPVILKGVTIQQVRSRKGRLLTQTKDPELVEKMKQIAVQQVPEGVKLIRQVFSIKPILSKKD